jgi:hypothetical protein
VEWTRRPGNEPTIMRAIAALAAGVFAGVFLVVAFTAARSSLTDTASHHLLFPADLQAFVALGLSLEAAVIIGLVAAPTWWVFRRVGCGGWRAAAMLGFVVTAIYWMASNAAEWRMAAGQAVWLGMVGSTSGLVVWSVAYRDRSSGST